jgi:PAS domain S-box-containing protein
MPDRTAPAANPADPLRISQERYALATAAAKVGVWDWDIVTGRFQLDPSLKSLLGYEDGELPNDLMVWSELTHPDDRGPALAAAQAHIDGTTPEYVCEHRMRHRDGSTRWILTRGRAIRDETGAAVRMVGTDMDITDRKRVEERLAETEERLRAIAAHVPGVVYSYDVDAAGRRTLNFCGPGLEALVGSASADRIRASLDYLFTIVHPGDRAGLQQAARMGVHLNQVVDRVVRLRNDDGRWVYVRSVCRPLRLADGSTRWHIVLVDVTSQMRSNRIQRSVVEATSRVVGTDFFAALVRALAEALEVERAFVCAHDPAVPGHARLLAGWSGGGPMPVLVFPIDRSAAAAVASGKVVFRAGPGQHTASAAPCPFACTKAFLALPLRDSTGTVIGHLGIAHDGPLDRDLGEQPVFSIVAARVTAEIERQRVEEELRRHVETETLLRSELNHRVRNNLASLASLVSVTGSTASDVPAFAATIGGRIRAMATAHSFLARSRWAPAPLRGLIEELVPAPLRGRFLLDGPPVEIPPHLVAPLGMVVHELVTNSIKHGAASAGGAVAIAWAHAPGDGDDPRLRVTWRESGGPRIAVAPVAGTGSSIIDGLVRSELRGAATLRYPATGAEHELVITFAADAP